MTRDNDFSSLVPTVSRAGSFFSTTDFIHPEMGDKYRVRLEAVEHPLTNRWQIQEVLTRPNTVSSFPEMVEDYGPYKGIQKENAVEKWSLKPNAPPLSGDTYDKVSLADAITALALFESSSRFMGYEADEAQKEELGEDHVEIFAARNGFVLDINGKPHLMIDGHVAGKGLFAPGAIRKAAALYADKPENKPAGTRTKLAYMFNSSVQVDDFSRVLDREHDLAQWNKLISAAKDALNYLSAMQSDKYSTEENSNFLLTTTVIRYEEDFRTVLQEARSILSQIDFISDADKNGKFRDFFEQVELANEVAMARCRYKACYRDPEKDNRKIRAEVEKLTQKAVEHCRAMGGSERDVQSLKAEIVDPEGTRTIREILDDGEKINYDISDMGYRRVYYFPRILFEFVADMGTVTDDLRHTLIQEKDRLRDVTKGEKIQRITGNESGSVMRFQPKQMP